MDRRLIIVWLAFGSVRCGEPPTEAPPATVTESQQAAADPERAAICDLREDTTIPERTDCSTTVRACQQDANGCLRQSVTLALVPFLHESCNFYCGQLQVGFRQGCITRVEGRVGPSVGAEPSYDALACMRRQLLGSRWDCAPINGEVAVLLGSCTIL